MTKKRGPYRITVAPQRGTTPFPYDQLRRCGAHPFASEDASKLADGADKRWDRNETVTLVCAFDPCVARWRSFGWDVVHIEGPGAEMVTDLAPKVERAAMKAAADAFAKQWGA